MTGDDPHPISVDSRASELRDRRRALSRSAVAGARGDVAGVLSARRRAHGRAARHDRRARAHDAEFVRFLMAQRPPALERPVAARSASLRGTRRRTSFAGAYRAAGTTGFAACATCRLRWRGGARPGTGRRSDHAGTRKPADRRPADVLGAPPALHSNRVRRGSNASLAPRLAARS